MPGKTRIRTLSTRWLFPFQAIVYLLYGGVLAALLWVYIPYRDWLGLAANGSIWTYFLYRLLLMTAKLRHVEFDEDFLYVIGRKTDVVIPLENVKDVEIITLGGVYRVNLYFADIVGEYFYFKPSLLYPLNYRSKDRLVNQLRDWIEKARKRNPQPISNALTS